VSAARLQYAWRMGAAAVVRNQMWLPWSAARFSAPVCVVLLGVWRLLSSWCCTMALDPAARRLRANTGLEHRKLYPKVRNTACPRHTITWRNIRGAGWSVSPGTLRLCPPSPCDPDRQILRITSLRRRETRWDRDNAPEHAARSSPRVTAILRARGRVVWDVGWRCEEASDCAPVPRLPLSGATRQGNARSWASRWATASRRPAAVVSSLGSTVAGSWVSTW